MVITYPADPWDPLPARLGGAHRLTCVEVTVTNRCNLRCGHCAVGQSLAPSDPRPLPLDLLLTRLDEAPDLTALNLTGGELSLDDRLLDETVLPLLQYARRRGLYTQVNTNLTAPVDRYLCLLPYSDVIHITWNYGSAADFHRIAWGHIGPESVSPAVSERLFVRLVSNIRRLAAAGAFLSGETMLSRETAPHLARLGRTLAQLGCRRHELNPMYPVDWAAHVPPLPLSEYREAVDRFLDERDPTLWALFGTFPFFACSPDPADQALLRKVRSAPHVTVRNCPDGRNRLNLNLFTGNLSVTDFSDWGPVGNLLTESLADAHARWVGGAAMAPFLCHCPAAGCTGPNPQVVAMYHADVDFRSREVRRE